MANKHDERKPLIRIQNLKQYFPLKRESIFDREVRVVKANDDISLDIYEGETLGLVGESGCGKSTLGRSILQLYEQTDGLTIYYGRKLEELAPKYVLDILENLSSKYKELKGLEEKVEQAYKSYERLPEGDEKYKQLEKARAIEKNKNNLFLDLTRLAGGLLLAEDLNKVSKVLVKEYKLKIEASNLRDEIDKLGTKIEGIKARMEEKGRSQEDIKDRTSKYTAKIEENKKKIVELEKEIEAIQGDIEKLREKCKEHPQFEEYESYRDEGIDLTKLTEDEMRLLRKDLQLIFQDPYSSLNPRLTVGQIIAEGLYAHNMFAKGDKSIQDYILKTMEECGLASYFLHRYPHQFSGGQRQRIGIARSVALRPKFIVCDEAVSALDVSIQSQILNLLLDLKEKQNLTYLFISHDLSVIKYISDRVAVMYLGNVIELAETEELYSRPMHPYTEALLAAIPTTDPDSKKEPIILEGDVPSPISPPPGCKFHTRCKYATDICSKVVPEFEEARPGHFVACHHKLNVED